MTTAPFAPTSSPVAVSPDTPAALLRQALRRIGCIALVLAVTALAHELASPAVVAPQASAAHPVAPVAPAGGALRQQDRQTDV